MGNVDPNPRRLSLRGKLRRAEQQLATARAKIEELEARNKLLSAAIAEKRRTDYVTNAQGGGLGLPG